MRPLDSNAPSRVGQLIGQFSRFLVAGDNMDLMTRPHQGGSEATIESRMGVEHPVIVESEFQFLAPPFHGRNQAQTRPKGVLITNQELTLGMANHT